MLQCYCCLLRGRHPRGGRLAPRRRAQSQVHRARSDCTMRAAGAYVWTRPFVVRTMLTLSESRNRHSLHCSAEEEAWRQAERPLRGPATYTFELVAGLILDTEI